ncbi:hypothetical protein K461DRAFT_275296 [Myriangium duriaei CBS 260.36]|uniref:Uncharacterized protein n=1 Tax=Myriangium duriaei CBS 260.36 TaxID=1168546 RepID=A0A9P4MIN7_9PEZI|nr:hypothetical protein K461DRAFT_275296 [Myriangium duriaei CBS 260.36]
MFVDSIERSDINAPAPDLSCEPFPYSTFLHFLFSSQIQKQPLQRNTHLLPYWPSHLLKSLPQSLRPCPSSDHLLSFARPIPLPQSRPNPSPTLSSPGQIPSLDFPLHKRRKHHGPRPHKLQRLLPLRIKQLNPYTLQKRPIQRQQPRLLQRHAYLSPRGILQGRRQIHKSSQLPHTPPPQLLPRHGAERKTHRRVYPPFVSQSRLHEG